jgi:hypothetical protein
MNTNHFLHYSFIDSNGVYHKNLLHYLASLNVQLCSYANNCDIITEFYVQPVLPNLRSLVCLCSKNTNPDRLRYYDTSFNSPKITVIKDALCLMYSQNWDAFGELTQQFYEDPSIFNENMKTFYSDIINFMNSQSYVLK